MKTLVLKKVELAESQGAGVVNAACANTMQPDRGGHKDQAGAHPRGQQADAACAQDRWAAGGVRKGNQQGATAAAPFWPLRPDVLVHVCY